MRSASFFILVSSRMCNSRFFVTICGAQQTAARHGRCFLVSEVQEEGTSNGSRSIRPTVRGMASSTRRTMALTVAVAIDHSGGSTNNNIYMLASVIPPGRSTTDVMFVRSTDGGLTFSAPHRVNDDPVNPSKWHWFGTFAVAPNGRLDAVWYDTRNAANNTDSELFYSWSTDDGVTWAPNVQVTNAFN